MNAFLERIKTDITDQWRCRSRNSGTGLAIGARTQGWSRGPGPTLRGPDKNFAWKYWIFLPPSLLWRLKCIKFVCGWSSALRHV